MEEKDKTLSKSTLITALSVFFLSLFIIFLFLSSKAAWMQKLKEASQGTEPLRQENITLKSKLEFYRKQDSVYAKMIAERTFDPKDIENFRMYGLFKDKGQKYTIEQVAQKFNIPNEKAIKLTEVQEDNWFIVPVKGMHFVRKAETAGSIAKKYYSDTGDSVLIKEFNPIIKMGNMIFIPYD
ncbi:MAG: hypothetical protein MUE81_09730 [Thermoflexibacter sp.]|nr:hypothetical protein [Thermoflexibacter sp.]